MVWFRLSMGAILWQASLILGQCFLQELTTTQGNGVGLHSKEIDLNQEIIGFLSLTALLKQESFLIKDDFIITGPNDQTCVYLGEGMRLHDIQESLTDTLNLPLLTQATILSNTRILLTTTKLTTVVSKTEFSQLVVILGFEDQVSMFAHPNIVFILEGSRKILTNFNLKDTNICQTSPTVLNLGHRLSRLINEMALVWSQLQKANLLYGRAVDLEGFSRCLDGVEVTFQELMLVTQDNLEFCKKGLMGSKKHRRKANLKTFVDINDQPSRKVRSISIGSFLLGEGSSIQDLQTSLHTTIEHYNSNFKSMEDFDNNLVSSLSSIQEDIEKIGNEEMNLHDGYLQIKQELEFTKNNLYYLTLKTQHIQALEDILVKSDLHENLILLERALFNSNICNFVQCEVKIFAIREATKIKIHTELLDLIPSKKQLITCQAKSSTHVSSWHNQLASISGLDTLILKDKMIQISNLQNESYVNQELRFLTQDEILLEVFHLFDKRKLQCLSKAEFLLDEHQTSCFELQTIKLSTDFTLEYKGHVISEEHTIGHVNLVASSWLQEYTFDNLPRSILQEDDQSQSVLHPILDALIISPAGQVSVEKVSILTCGTLVFLLLCCPGCLYKHKKFRDCLWNSLTLIGSKIYTCVTTEKHRTEKENDILRKGLAEQKAKIRENINDLNLMTSLERSLLNNAQRLSLPNISRAVQFEDSSMAPQIEFDHLGAQAGTQWNQLEHVVEEPGVGVEDHHQLGAGGGRDWRELKRLGKPVDHSVIHHKRRPE